VGAAGRGGARRRTVIADGTVKNHVPNVLTKLDARDRTQAALRARALGLV
jgi:DNA-binding NarL/FixJ family response regulator